ncbi:hypothetical protein QF000_006496 [Paraburkholderia atlantica]|uniref:hypothetical protein n=1 Tax=Paraburkholderia atlantica TaxID=2654982 RepID=UPI003D229801
MSVSSVGYQLMSLKEADLRADAYVQDALSRRESKDFADPDTRVEVIAFDLRRQFYDFLMAHYVLVDEEAPVESET